MTTDEGVFIALGSNLGDRAAWLRKAQEKLFNSSAVQLARASAVYETAPVGKIDQPAFLNQVIEVRTSLAPEDLLSSLLQVEQELGRVRAERWGPRRIDLDLLAFGQRQIKTGQLVLPHPELHRRRFVLQPWSEIATEFIVAGFSATVGELLQRCNDNSGIHVTQPALPKPKAGQGRFDWLMKHTKRTAVNQFPNSRVTLRLQYIVIEGVIGAGKTSLATRMAEKFGGRLLLEQHEENPFLPDFYQDPRHYAFSTQMFFLLSRYRQQQEIPQRDLFQQLLIADYLFAKDRIFASLTLEERELSLYDKVAKLLERDISPPDLAIYLQSSTERLLANIRSRNRSYEKPITEEYIRDLNDAYNRFFFNYTATPLLVINATEIDFVHNEQDFEDLLAQLHRPISGVQYYSPVK